MSRNAHKNKILSVLPIIGMGNADVKHKGMRSTQKMWVENTTTLSDPERRIVERKVEKEETVRRGIGRDEAEDDKRRTRRKKGKKMEKKRERKRKRRNRRGNGGICGK